MYSLPNTPKPPKKELFLFSGAKTKTNKYLVHAKNMMLGQVQYLLFLGKWEKIRDMIVPRMGGNAIIFRGGIYIFGGVSLFEQYPTSIEVYDIVRD